MTETTPADHRYIQVARALRKDIVDGVYPVGSQLPTEHELCERFSVSRYTVREALRRLREDNLVSSRPRAGTLVVPRSTSDAYDVMSINDLVAFATERPVRHRVHQHGDARTTRSPPGPDSAAVRSGWPSRGFRQSEGAEFPLCRTEYYINRAFAAIGRLLQRHTGPIFPLIEDLFGVSIVEVHQEIAAVLIAPALAAWPQGRARIARHWRCSARTRHRTARSRRSRSTPIPHRGSGTR